MNVMHRVPLLSTRANALALQRRALRATAFPPRPRETSRPDDKAAELLAMARAKQKAAEAILGGPIGMKPQRLPMHASDEVKMCQNVGKHTAKPGLDMVEKGYR